MVFGHVYQALGTDDGSLPHPSLNAPPQSPWGEVPLPAPHLAANPAPAIPQGVSATPLPRPPAPQLQGRPRGSGGARSIIVGAAVSGLAAVGVGFLIERVVSRPALWFMLGAGAYLGNTIARGR